MTAIIAFLIAGIGFITVAATFQLFVMRRVALPLLPFALAFYGLGAAFLYWAFAVSSGNQTVLSQSVIIGEGLILGGTVGLLTLILPRNWRTGVVVGGTLGVVGLLWLRATAFYPQPFMMEGVLVFNIPRQIVAMYVLLVAGVWYPAGRLVASNVAAALGQPSLSATIKYIYIMTAISAVAFTASRQVSTITATFTALVACCALMIYANVLVNVTNVEPVKPVKQVKKVRRAKS